MTLRKCMGERGDYLIFEEKYNNLANHNKNLLLNTATECSRLCMAAKEKNLTQLIAQLEDPKTDSKTYWSIES